MDKKGRAIGLIVLFLVLGIIFYLCIQQILPNLAMVYNIGISAIIAFILASYIHKKF
jgi:hypothetical protein